MARQVPWLRVFAEGFAIVVSILLAFGIQAWWEARQDGLDEQMSLHSLRADFVTSRDELFTTIRSLERSRDNFAALQAASPNEVVQLVSDSVGRFVSSLTMARTYDPVSGTLDALVSDGRLSLLTDPALRQRLSTWLQYVEDMDENQGAVREESTRVLRAMESHGGPLHAPYLGAPHPAVPEASPEALAALRADSSFMAVARTLHYQIGAYLRELNRLLGVMDEILSLIDRNIA